MMISRFSFPTSIVFGVGAVKEIGGLAKKVGGTRALIVTDKGVAKAGLIAPVQQALEAAGVPSVVFDGVAPNPTEADVDAGIAAYRESGSDFLVGVGGGSPLDGAKAIRLRVTHTLPLEEYDDNIGGDAKINNNMPPMLAIPTTAGTGSEVGRSAVIICKANDRKTVIFSPYLMPNYAVCDPEMTAGMPPVITAATGMDAFTHNIESYLAKGYHPLADAMALYGMRLCGKSLRRAVENGRDLDARADMMMAAIMGATAFQKGLGVTHSLAHPLSSIGGMHHGMANAVLLPYVLEYNADSCPQKYLDIAKTLDLPAKPEAVIQWVRDLNASIGVPAKLNGFGITREMIPAMAEKALLDGCYLTNPKPCDAESMRALYAAAL
ncbi:MAG TPA: iron-containing alcohol dehydrogenase [Chthonomonadaceae bacterium]|nr:iron-containing alcohol dehydrogenase [Chthonomonadaceae bacterium]